jgi:peptide/nickel transport system substrate-binding protein
VIRTRIGALVAVTAIIAAACGGSAATSEAPSTPPDATAAPTTAPTVDPNAVKTGGTLVVAIPSELSRTDPSLVDDGGSIYVLQNVVETLVQLEQGSGSSIIPALAESWTTSDDGLTYTFKIREGVKFHDGTALDAAAVKYNVDRWINIPQSYIDQGYTYYIDTVIGHGDGANIVATAAPDATTFELTLAKPNSAFLVTLTLPVFGISSPTALEAGGASDPDFSKNTFATGGAHAAVGTGPFVFKEWVTGDHVTLDKNPEYWNAAAGGPYLDSISVRFIGDSTATANALQAGDIDVAQILAPNDVPALQADTNLQYFDRGSACNVGVLSMNQTHKPFDNALIRRAVGHAINRQAIRDAFFGETGVDPKGWAPPGTLYAAELDLPEYDPQKAKDLIAESGVTDLSFDFWYPSDVSRPYMPDPKGEFEAMLTDLEAVGFQPNPMTAPWNPDYLTAESIGTYPMWIIGWNCDWLGIDNFLVTAFFGYQSGEPNKEYAYENDAMNAAMEAALAAPDAATQEAEWLKAQNFIAEDMPSLPIVSAKTPSAGQTYVKGFIPGPTQFELFTNVWLDR